MRALFGLVILLLFGVVQTPSIKRILRRFTSCSISGFLRLRSRNFTPAENAVTVIIAPHQDDSTLGCGGLVARKRLDGHPVHVIYVTDGSASHPEHPTLAPAEIAAIRKQEGLAALRMLGVETPAIHFLGATDGTLNHLPPDQASALVTKLRELLRGLRADEVFLPYRRDGSSEHEAAFRLFLEALAGLESPPRVFEYLVWSWWNPLRLVRPALTARRVWRYRFRGYEDIKASALTCYQSQFEPTSPWKEPVLSAEFVSYFRHSSEFYFET
jgi:LmbE family N-acetylglucosaminyl deacetylase